MTDTMVEAATYKATAMRLARDIETLLADRSVPSALRKEVEDVRAMLKRTWSDLAADADGEEPEEAPEPEPEPEAESVSGIGLLERVMVRLPGGRRVPFLDCVEAYQREAETKTEGGESYPPSAYLVVEDEDSPSTWHLRVRDADSELDHRLMGAAWAALHQGYRGNVYEGPDKQAAIDKLKALYDAEDMPTPGETSEQREAYFAESLAEADMGGELLGIVEEAVPDDAPRGTLCLVDFVPIEPGWGNQKDNHHYGRELLRRESPKFVGAKMYATNHVESEKNVRNEVSQIVQCPVRFTETGAPVARAAVYDRDFEYSVRQRAKANRLADLHCSIFADGLVKEGFELDGRQGKDVTSITEIKSVDWVARAGAGGRALSLVEAAQEAPTSQGESDMSDKEEMKVTEEVTEQEPELKKEPIRETEQPQSLSTATVLKALLEADLPTPVALRLAAREYEDEAALTEAVEAATTEVTAILESAKPERKDPPSKAFGLREQSASAQQEEQPDTKAQIHAVLANYGIVRSK